MQKSIQIRYATPSKTVTPQNFSSELCTRDYFDGNAPRSNRWTDFHALWLKRPVSVQESAFWRRTPPPHKVGVNKQFQAKNVKI